MKARRTAVVAALAAIVVIGTVATTLRGAPPPDGKSFGWVDPDYTQELFATTSSFAKGGNYLGGVAVLPSGDVLAAECVTTGTRLHRFSGTLTIQKNGTAIHVETILPSAGGCGIVYHPDGTVYLNMNDGTHGIANVNPTTGALIRYLGTPGNAVGIAVDPVSNHIVYADKNCVSTVKAPNKCSLLDLDTVSGVVTTRVSFPITSVAFVNGIYFDPTGAYMFLSNRFPTPTVTVLTSDGTIVQNLDMGGSDPVGIGFNALSPKFVVTNNTDGSMTRFDFPNDDYTQVPASSNLALFGYRGDLMQAGPDGCLYVTQGGARYDDGTDENGSKSNSLARLCGGFAPPAGVPTNAPPVAQGTLLGTVTDALTGAPLVSAKVLVATGTGISVMTDGNGQYSLPLAPGVYSATTSATNYTPLTAPTITILNTKDTTNDFALMPLPGTLQGVVTSAATGSPVVGAVVTLTGGPSIGKSDATDPSGRYVINAVLPGTYTATITQTYYDTLTAPNVAVPINATGTTNFALTQTPGTIQGTITGNAGPIAGATVTLSGGATATADGAGHYVFASIVPGVYSATAAAATFASTTTNNVSLPNAGSKTVDFTLTPLPGTLQGTVRNAAGTGVANATVTFAGKSVKTNPSGGYSIPNITPGTYPLTVAATNYDAYSVAAIVIANAATVNYDVNLTQTPGPITGVIRDTSARPLAGATVTLSNNSTTVSDPTGAYAFTSVVPGNYTVTASLATYANASANVVLANASSVKQDLALAPLPGTLSGVVSNAAGQPVAAVSISLGPGKTANSDPTGSYRISTITPGTYSATVTAANYDTQTIPGIVIGNAANVTLNITLTQTPGTLKGIVVNAANAPIANASVVLSNGAAATTDATGSYAVTPIMPGSYSATVSAANYNTSVTPPNSIVIANAGTATRNFTLSQTPGRLTGTVTAADGTTPLAGATVTLTGGASTQTTPAGAYTFASVTPGSYTVTATAATYQTSAAVSIVMPNNGAISQNFALTPLPGALQGTVKDGVGNAIVGAAIQFTSGSGMVTTATSGAGGAYSVGSVVPGTYAASASMATYATQSVPSVVVGNGATVTQNFTLIAQPGSLRGVVSDSKGPIAGATVTLSNGGGSATTDVNGNYVFASLAPATYSATVSAPTYNTATVPGIVIANASSVTQNITLTPMPGSLKGIVTDGTNPIAGATVALSSGGSTVSDATGAYAFASLAPGTYTATVSAATYNTLTVAGVAIANAAAVTQNFTLTPLPGVLQGTVTNAAGAVVPSSVVKLSSGASATTDASGRYSFSSLNPGTYSATATATNYDVVSASAIVIPNASSTTYNFTLTQTPGTLQGTVTGVGGAAVVGATVQIAGGAAVSTDGAGHYLFPSLMPGTYGLSVTASNYNPLTVSGIVMPNAGAITRDLALTQTPGTLSGVVSDTTGARVSGARVSLQNGAVGIADGTGSYTITGLAPGSYSATVSAATYNNAAVPNIVIVNASTTTQNFTLQPLPGTVQGTVTDAGGVAKIAGATVVLSSGGAVLGSMTTTASGAFAFSSVAPGSYVVTVSAAGYLGQTATVAVVNAGTTTRNFLLTPSNGSLQGVVSSAAGGTITGATVALSNGMSSTTDTAGHYGFAALAPGTYSATVTAPPPTTDPCAAANAYFGLGPASTYTMLGIDVAGCAGTKINMGGKTAVVAGDLGVGDSTSATISAGTIQGKLLVDPSGVYTLAKTGVTIQGGVSRPSLDDAISAVTAAATRLAKLAATQKLNAITASTTIKGSGGVNVVAIPSVDVVNGTITIQGTASDIFVINVAGKFDLDNTDIVLAGGVRACNLLWNFTGSTISANNEVELENGSNAVGIFLALSRLVDLESSMLTGQVLAGGDLELWSSTVQMPAPVAYNSVAYDTLTVSGIVIPPGGAVTQNFALTVTVPATCIAPNTYFGLGTSAAYSLLGIDVSGCSGSSIDMGGKTASITGDVGVAGSVYATMEGGTVQGKLIVDPSGGYTISKSGGTVVQGGVSRVDVDAAAAAASSAAARLAKLTPTQKLNAITSSSTIKGTGGVNVITLPSLDVVNGTVTIQGTASDIFVINVAGKFELDGSRVVLTGGAKACNLLWNFTGSAISENNEVELENGSTGAGIFLALSRLVDLEDSTLNGRILAGGDLEIWSSTIKQQ